MARYRLLRLPYVLTLTLSTLSLGAVGCSNGSSPTEPAFDAAPVATASSASVTSVSGEKRGGNDDPANHDANDDNNNNRRGRRQGRGNDDRPQQPNAGAQFAGKVVSVSGSTLTLAGGARVTVNGATQFSARGDLTSLSQVAAAVAANRPTRVEGRGTRQADGTFLAQTIKAEVDD
jgi:hypothetical protein